MKFPLGQILITPGAQEAIPNLEVLSALRRHFEGDWGEVCEADKAENERSLKHGLRILSVYRSSKNIKFWIITEADRSATTILLPEEY